MEYIGVVTGGTYTDGNKYCFSTTFMSAENYYKGLRKLDFLEDILKDFIGKNILINIVEGAIYAHYDKDIESLINRFLYMETQSHFVHNIEGVLSFKREYYRTIHGNKFDYINCYLGELNLTKFIREHENNFNQKQFLRLRIENY
jgi:hypothetical protein